MDVPVLAGVISTVLFGVSTLPMLHKAARSKDLQSYSAANLAISNAGNAFHSIYVFSLPVGPIWFLHSFYVVSTALMLAWYVRYRTMRGNSNERRVPVSEEQMVRPRVAGEVPSPTQLGELEVPA